MKNILYDKCFLMTTICQKHYEYNKYLLKQCKDNNVFY